VGALALRDPALITTETTFARHELA